MTVQVITIC